MNIQLNVLLDAVQAMKMLRDVADAHLTPEQYMQGLHAWSALKSHVQYITEQVKVEVPA